MNKVLKGLFKVALSYLLTLGYLFCFNNMFIEEKINCFPNSSSNLQLKKIINKSSFCSSAQDFQSTIAKIFSQSRLSPIYYPSSKSNKFIMNIRPNLDDKNLILFKTCLLFPKRNRHTLLNYKFDSSYYPSYIYFHLPVFAFSPSIDYMTNSFQILKRSKSRKTKYSYLLASSFSSSHLTNNLSQDDLPLIPVRYKQQRDELYKKLFQTSAPSLPEDLPIRMAINGDSKLNVPVTFNDINTDFTFSSSVLLDELSLYLNEATYQALVNQQTTDNRLSFKSLRKVGLELSFAYSSRSLNIFIPANLLGVRQHYIRGSKPINLKKIISFEPSTFSGFFNYRLQNVYNIHSKNQNRTLRGWTGSFDTAFNFRQKVLEGSFQYNQRGVHSFQRIDTRLVIDLDSPVSRLVFGDLKYPTVGNQSYINMAGVALSKNFTLASYQNSYVSGDLDYYLEKDSDVEIWINDTIVSRLKLQAGPHSFKKLPYSDGANEVELRITDKEGKQQTLRFDFIKDLEILAPGYNQYTLNVGFPSKAQGADRRYQLKDLFGSFFYSQGFSNNFSGSSYLQLNSQQSLLGLRIINLISFLKCLTQLDISRIYGNTIDYSTQIVWTPKRKSNQSSFNWSLNGTYTGRKFARIGELEPNNINRCTFGSRCSFALPFLFNLGLNANLMCNRDSNPISYSFSTSLSRPLGRWASLNISTQNERNTGDQKKLSLLLGLSFLKNFHEWSTSGSYAHSHNDRIVSFQAVYSPRHQPTYRQTQVSNGIRVSETTTAWETAVSQNLNKVRAEIRFNAEDPKQKGSKATQSITGNLRGALVFADGSAAFSNEVQQGGFVIFEGVKNLKNTPILLNPSLNNCIGKSARFFGGAVYSNLNAYYPSTLRIGLENPPISFEFKKVSYIFVPQYRQGFKVVLGSDTTHLVKGLLLNRKSEPIAYATIAIQPIDPVPGKPIYTFTGERGTFSIQGLCAGKYQLQVIGKGKDKPIDFTLSERIPEIFLMDPVVIDYKIEK